MSFLYPSFLWALTAMAIPLIIHLFNFRRHKTVYFSQTRFLESVRKDTRSRTNIRQLLILLSRMLMIAALVLAFARPVILPEGDSEEQEPVGSVMLCLDNSYSMQNEGENGKLIDMARQKATEIAEAYGEGVDYYLFTNDMPPRYYRPMAYEDFLIEVGQVGVSPVSMKLEKLIERLKSSVKTRSFEGRLPVYLISDFQKSTMEFDDFSGLDKFDMHAVLINGVEDENLSIDSVWFDTPFRQTGKPERLSVLIRNHGTQNYSDMSLQMELNDSLRAVSTFSIDAGESTEAQLTYTNPADGFQKARLSIDDYPVSFDNNFYFTYPLEKQKSILLINGADKQEFPQEIFDDTSRFDVSQVQADALDYTFLDAYDVLIFNGIEHISDGMSSQLLDGLDKAGSLVFIPGRNMDTDSWNRFSDEVRGPRYREWDSISRKIDDIAWEHAFFADVFSSRQENADLPEIKGRYPMQKKAESRSETLLEMTDGSSFLDIVSRENSLLYFFSAPLERNESSFVRHPVFVPVAYNMVMNTPTDQPLYYLVGRGGSLRTDVQPTGEGGVEIRSGNEESLIPSYRETRTGLNIFIPEALDHAGFYDVYVNDVFTKGFALNMSPLESEMEFYDSENLKASAEARNFSLKQVYDARDTSLTGSIEESEQGKPLWPWFLLLALFFVLAEIALIKLM